MPRTELLQQLQQRLRRAETERRGGAPPCSTGLPELDRLLPAGGLLPGTLLESLAEPGHGGLLCWLPAVRLALQRTSRLWVVIDPQDAPSRSAAAWGDRLPLEPPAAPGTPVARTRQGAPAGRTPSALQSAWPARGAPAARGLPHADAEGPAARFFPLPAWGWGLPGNRLVWLRPQTSLETAWCLEQALQSPAVAWTWCFVGLTPERIVRRWKLAAERGGGCGLLCRRPERTRGHPWTDLRCLIRGQPGGGRSRRRVRLELLHCRGDFRGGTLDLEIDDAAAAVRVVSSLADSTAAARAAGA